MLHVEEYNELLKFEQRNLITQAYLTASWQRVKKMPRLRQVLADLEPKKEQPKPQSDKQLLAAALQWQKRFEREEER